MFYDTLTHPTLNGMWIDNRKGQTFSELYDYAIKNDIAGSCAVGLPNIGDYNHKKFMSESIKFSDFFYPVAAITKKNIDEIIMEIDEIESYGFQAIKIHPRFLGINFTSKDLTSIFEKCFRKNLVVFYCSYYHCNISKISISDPYWTLIAALKNSPDTKIVLLHGGGIELLKYAELARFNSNILLDLSLTLMKYDRSSIDNDIHFLFNNFDQRISIGSDHPEWEYKKIKQKLKLLTENLEHKKMNNILKDNAQNFLGIKK